MAARHRIPTNAESLALVQRVNPKYRPIWDERGHREQVALARYYLPHSSAKPMIIPTRPRIIKLYCPFAHQCQFPSGHRYCINIFTGCSHGCVYCYASAYSPDGASPKDSFERLIDRDLADLERFDVPPAPVHLSNSTDPFQPLEERFGHTLYALRRLAGFRHRFTTVTVLTKNPAMAARPDYLEALRRLMTLPESHPARERFAAESRPALCVEVSLAFWRDEARAAYDPHAPTAGERMEGVRALASAGIPLLLRIDPLLPRSPLNADGATLADFHLPEAQTLDDLRRLVAFAREAGARHVVYSPMKIVQPRGRKLGQTMQHLRDAYRRMAGKEKLVFQGGSWRLPREVAQARIVDSFLAICREDGVVAKFCKANLLGTI